MIYVQVSPMFHSGLYAEILTTQKFYNNFCELTEFSDPNVSTVHHMQKSFDSDTRDRVLGLELRDLVGAQHY